MIPGMPARLRSADAHANVHGTYSFVLPDLAPGAIRELRNPDAADDDDELARAGGRALAGSGDSGSGTKSPARNPVRGGLNGTGRSGTTCVHVFDLPPSTHLMRGGRLA